MYPRSSECRRCGEYIEWTSSILYDMPIIDLCDKCFNQFASVKNVKLLKFLE